jgi:putative membrane protein
MKRFNLDEFLWFIILLAFTVYFYYLLSTGKISMFISPRLTKYIIFALIGFGILTLYQYTKIFTIRSRRPLNKSYILLFVTLIIGYIAAQNGLNSSIVEKKGVDLAVVTDKKEVTTLDKSTNNAVKNMQLQSEEELIDDGGTIEFTNDNYSRQLVKIEDNFEKYKGRKVIITGFVYKENNFKSDEFVAARLFMSCCAADSQVIGLMSKWEKATTLDKDEWVKIGGTIDSTKYKDSQTGKEMNIPLIKVDKVEKIQKPDNPFIYP